MTAAARAFLVGHRAHDAAWLLRCWVAAAGDAGWESREIFRAGPFPVLALTSPGDGGGGLYLSGGMHGDEPGAALGLLRWFETNGRRLAARRIVIFPCLNPCGLLANTRVNEFGEDLNRQFHRADHPFIAAWRAFMNGRRFALAVCLHEDYDARGAYVYELYHRGRPPLADTLLKRVEPIIPRDPRKMIDGRSAKKGVIRRNEIPRDLPGHPEAIALHLGWANHNLTFETPSEFSLDDRVRAHGAFLDACLRSQ